MSNKCPKCGEKARTIIATVRAEFALNKDGTLGEVLQVVDQPKNYFFQCGGGHQWK